ncbi:hypothetical protein TNCV_4543941 [Trichonephila clavipes]|nr:hypothetical protein TNCV_4543941 [Trichonephila clavipes]
MEQQTAIVNGPRNFGPQSSDEVPTLSDPDPHYTTYFQWNQGSNSYVAHELVIMTTMATLATKERELNCGI